MIVTSYSHPHVFAAFEVISHDVGAGSGHTNYDIPDEWSPDLPAIEGALVSLTPEEFETFCIGEDTDQKTIMARSNSMRLAWTLLEAFFNDFE